jgi:hypothetical protein
MQNKLVTFGCSFTYGHGLPDCHIPPNAPGPMPSSFAWPAIVANSLNKVLDNQSKCGASNLEILHKILNYNFNSNDLVVIMWSLPNRDVIFKDQSMIPLGVWNTDTLTKDWINVHSEEDLAIRSWLYIHHASLYFKEKQIKHYNIFANLDFLKNYKPSFLNLDYLKIDMSERVDNGLDGKHPGLTTHKILADRFLNFIKNER